MKVEAQSANATPGLPNVTLNFSDTVDQFLVGITRLDYTFGSKDHHVLQIKSSMAPGNSGEDVSVSVAMTLNDSNGHDISSSSSIEVGCIAATGPNTNQNVQLSSALSYPSGGSSAPIALQNNTFVNQPIMSGFDLAYSKDHHVKRMTGDVSVSVQQEVSATLSGSCNMYDDSGNSAVIKNLQGGYLGTYLKGSASGLVAIQLHFDQNSGIQSVDMTPYLNGKTLTGAVVLLKSFDLSFGGDHHMKTLNIGALDVANTSTSISFTPQCQMFDNSGHHASGNISLIVIGTCSAD